MSDDLTILPLKTDKSSIKLKTPINPILMDTTPIKMYDGSRKQFCFVNFQS